MHFYTEESEMANDYTDRFSGVGRLLGKEAFERLGNARVCVIGIGGVGSWTVEALARSGVGEITMIDLDDICVTNVNRQLHAIDGQIGRSKADAMAERVSAINPGCDVVVQEKFFTAETAEQLLAPNYDLVVDAIDTLDQKALLIAEVRKRELPLVVCGGAGGKRDATAIRVADLARASHDPLLRQVRKTLRREFGFPRNDIVDFGVRAVFSVENPVYPWSDGTVRDFTEPGSELRLNCDSGFGTAAFVTGGFGFAAAGEAVRILSGLAVAR
jgi:tRNA A37 threonylcarbamoyladenosine dehydratase